MPRCRCHHVCTTYNPAHLAPDGSLTDSAARYRSRIRVQHVYSGCNPKSNTISGGHRPRRHQGRATNIIGIVDPAGATEDSRENMQRPVCGNVRAIARGLGRRSRSKMQREERQEEGPKNPKHCVVDAGVQCLCGGNGEETPRTGTRFGSIHGPDSSGQQTVQG